MSSTINRVNFFRNVSLLVTQCANEGISLMPFSFYRSHAEQKILVEQGKSRRIDSLHRQWLAIDLVLVHDHELVWRRTSEYDRAGAIWTALGGVWGGNWKSFPDIFHFEFNLKGLTRPEG